MDASEKSEKQRNDYLKSLLNDEQPQIYDEDLLRQNQTVPIETLQKVNSDNSGCLEDDIGNEYINSSIHEQINDMVESSASLLKKKKSPKKNMIPVVSPSKQRNYNVSAMAKNNTTKSKRQKINEKRERRKSFDGLKMP